LVGAESPWHEFIDAVDLVNGDTGERVSESGLGIDTVELGGFDEGVGDRRRLSAALGALKEVVLPADRHTAYGSIGGVVVELQDAVIELEP